MPILRRDTVVLIPAGTTFTVAGDISDAGTRSSSAAALAKNLHDEPVEPTGTSAVLLVRGAYLTVQSDVPMSDGSDVESGTTVLVQPGTSVGPISKLGPPSPGKSGQDGSWKAPLAGLGALALLVGIGVALR